MPIVYESVKGSPRTRQEADDAFRLLSARSDAAMPAAEFGFSTSASAAANAAALNAAIVAARAQSYNSGSGYVQLPAGDFPIAALGTILDQASSPRQVVQIRGAGRDQTRLRYTANLGAPLFNLSVPSEKSYLGFDFRDFTIDGAGFSGIALNISHCNKASIERLAIRNVLDIAIHAEEWWDSTVIDLYLHTCGDLANLKPSLRLKNRDVADGNSSCNNIGFYDLHVEEHPYRGIELLETTRKLTFTRLKLHHNPSAPPPAGTDHVVLDAMNVAAGGGYGISFIGCHVTFGSGSGIVLKNTGGTSANGFRNVHHVSGSLHGLADYGVKLLASGGFTMADTDIDSAVDAGVSIDTDAIGTYIDWPSVRLPGTATFAHHSIAGTPLASAKNRPPIVGGVLNVYGPYMSLSSAAAETINSLTAGAHGQRVTLMQRPGSTAGNAHTITNAGNIVTATGSNIVLNAAGKAIDLVYDATQSKWYQPVSA